MATVVLLLSVVIVSLVALLPGQSRVALGLELLALALFFAVFVGYLVRPRPDEHESRGRVLGREATMLLGTLPFLIGAVSLLLEAGGGLYWVAAGIVTAIAGGVTNALGPARGDPALVDDVVSLHDFEPLARAAIEPGAFGYVAGGAWDELTLADNLAAWRRRTLRPRVLIDVSGVTAATTLLGAAASMPVAIAPVAAHGLMHPDGEFATARAAAAAGVPFILSTFASRSIEAVAEAAPDAPRWFQLYVQTDAGRTRDLVERAAAAGYGALVLTVDMPVLGYRERDRRSRFDTTDPRRPLELPGAEERSQPPPTLTWADLAGIRAWAPGLPLVLKGILTAEDARLAVEHGADGVVVSNHGARQLDRVAATADVLEEVAGAVGGRAEVWVDGGVRRGLDVAIALALGARGVLVGRPVLWALAAGGQAGVERALAILREETELALALLGVTDPAGVTRAHVAR